jgi:hypothetical protein
MDAQSILTFIGGCVATATTMFVLYLPFVVLFLVLLLIVGLLELLVLPLIVLFRRRRPGSSDGPAGIRLLH